MIAGLPTYRVQRSERQPLVDFMLTSLRDAGCRVIYASAADRAPFIMSFETPAGERMGIVAYAFLATRTPTKNRPTDERSFQIKYGPDDKALHELWQDSLGLFTTLLVGIDPNEGFFVAADPELHNPTRFYIRLEFKDMHAEEIKTHGWYAWERERRGPRHLSPEERTFDFEALVGGTAEHFLDLVRFERAAQGLPPGDRQLVAERPELFAVSTLPRRESVESASSSLHPLAAEFELEPDQILELIANARRLKMAVRGWVAEEKLRDSLSLTAGVTHCERLDEEGGPDLRIRWKDGPPLTVECKNVLRKANAEGLPRIDFQRTRAAKGDPCSRYYALNDFDILAGCLHAVTERWEFQFVRPILLARHKTCVGKLASNVIIDKLWTPDAGAAFEAVDPSR
jgi:hypothetical protein